MKRVLVALPFLASCAGAYPQALSQCSSVTIAADNADTGCVISYSGCPSFGKGTITCGPRNGGSFFCQCTYEANDFVTSKGGTDGFGADDNVCTRDVNGLRQLAQECP